MKYFAKKIVKNITMTSHLGFEWHIPNVIVLIVMFILRSHTRRRPYTDVQNCCTWTDVKQFLSPYCKRSYKAEQPILHFVKNWLVGTIRIIYLY